MGGPQGRVDLGGRVWDVWPTGLHTPACCDSAQACGALGIAVRETHELDAALARALAHDGPSLVEIAADAELV